MLHVSLQPAERGAKPFSIGGCAGTNDFGQVVNATEALMVQEVEPMMLR